MSLVLRSLLKNLKFSGEREEGPRKRGSKIIPIVVKISKNTTQKFTLIKGGLHIMFNTTDSHFVKWFTETYLSPEKVQNAYMKELVKLQNEQANIIIEQLQIDLSPCGSCNSYAACNKMGEQYCQKRFLLNDAIKQSVYTAFERINKL